MSQLAFLLVHCGQNNILDVQSTMIFDLHGLNNRRYFTRVSGQTYKLRKWVICERIEFAKLLGLYIQPDKHSFSDDHSIEAVARQLQTRTVIHSKALCCIYNLLNKRSFSDDHLIESAVARQLQTRTVMTFKSTSLHLIVRQFMSSSCTDRYSAA